jgi:hypothetical protein
VVPGVDNVTTKQRGVLTTDPIHKSVRPSQETGM